MSQPTEHDRQADLFEVLADLASQAAELGVPGPAPLWSVLGGVSAHIRTEDDTALRAFDVWRRILNPHRVHSFSHTDAEGVLRTVTVAECRFRGVSIDFSANVPAPVAAAHIASGVAA